MFNFLRKKTNSEAPQALGDKIGAFWHWFEVNLHKFTPGPELTGDELQQSGLFEQLRKVNDRLAYELGIDPSGTNEFIISAEGQTQEFSTVFELVGKAPKIAGWKFTALKPPMGFDFNYEENEIVIRVSELTFGWMTAEGTDFIGLSIFIPDFDNALEERYIAGLWRVVESGLGEWLTSTVIGYIGVTNEPIPEDAAYDINDLESVAQHHLKTLGKPYPYENMN